MGETVIRVEGLGKRYRIGEAVSYRNLRKAVANVATAPLRWMGKGAVNDNDNHIWALRDVSFEVNRGEVVGLIGRNGAGKSTVLKILSRITEPTEGRAEIYGRVGSLLEVGTGFHPELTGRENIYLNGTILGMKKAEIHGKFDEIVDFSELEQFVDTPVKRYSSGMYTRLAFAVAAHLEPEILIVDEVLAVGDTGFQKKCLGKMQDVAKGGRTVLFVSHNLSAVESLCTRAIYLRKGRVAEVGSTRQVLDAYMLQVSGEVQEQLSERTDRFGSGIVKSEAVYLRNNKGQPIPSVRTGQDVQIAVKYISERESVGGVSFTINFWTMQHQLLFKCISNLYQPPFKLDARTGYFVCTIPKFPLNPGQYAVELKCSVNSATSDNISHALCIDVEAGDFYGSGQSSDDPRGGVCVEHEWEVLEEHEPLAEAGSPERRQD